MWNAEIYNRYGKEWEMDNGETTEQNKFEFDRGENTCLN